MPTPAPLCGCASQCLIGCAVDAAFCDKRLPRQRKATGTSSVCSLVQCTV
jgi:hypothetical protein